MASRSKADANGLLEPQFFVEHRIKTIFGEIVVKFEYAHVRTLTPTWRLLPIKKRHTEEKPEVRQFSMHSVASEISKSRNKYVNGQLLGGLELQSDSEKSSKHGVVAEDLHAMLSTLQLRLNDTCILSPDDEVSETAGEFSRNASKGASRIHSPIVSRTPSGLLTPGDHSRDPSCSRGSSHSSSKKHSPGYLSPVSMSQASSRANSPTGKSTSLAAAAYVAYLNVYLAVFSFKTFVLWKTLKWAEILFQISSAIFDMIKETYLERQRWTNAIKSNESLVLMNCVLKIKHHSNE